MFGGLGDTFKNLTGKAEEVLEKTKKDVEALAIEKKAAAQAMLEEQAKKTGEALMHSKSEIEKSAAEVAGDAKKSAIDGFDKEVDNAEKAVDGAVQDKTEVKPVEASPMEGAKEMATGAKEMATGAIGQLGGVEKEIENAVGGAVKQAGTAVDAGLKEAEHYLDEKRGEVVKKVQEVSEKATKETSEGVGSVLGKAKGFMNF